MIVNQKLGFMQGRLSSPIEGKIQAFPFDTWKNEFVQEKKRGFTCIEWNFEVPTYKEKPPLY